MRVVLPFSDDSGLIFAARLAPLLAAAGATPETWLLDDGSDEAAVSERQVALHLPGGVARRGPLAAFVAADAALAADAIVVSRITADLRDALTARAFRDRRPRPALVAFNAGLEFTPERGRKNRRDFDVVFLNSAGERDAFAAAMAGRPGWRRVSFGHPYALTPATWRPDDGRGRITFFAQALSPKTPAARHHIVALLAEIARANPGREVAIKLRHLVSENTRHVHREELPYETIVRDDFPDRPRNLVFDAGSMAEALARTSVAITCTSTAAIDAVSAGVPTLVYLDYVETWLDPLAEPMRAAFAGSGLIATLPEVLALTVRPPAPDWLARNFRGPEFVDELIEAIAAFGRGAAAG